MLRCGVSTLLHLGYHKLCMFCHVNPFHNAFLSLNGKVLFGFFFFFQGRHFCFINMKAKTRTISTEKQEDMSLLLPLINAEGMGPLIQCHLRHTQNARVGDQVTWSLQTLTSYEGISSAGPQKLPTHYMNTDWIQALPINTTLFTF